MDLGEFGRQLRHQREEAGISLGRFATQLGFSKGYLSRVERGHKLPSRFAAECADQFLDARGKLLVSWTATRNLKTEGGEEASQRREFIALTGAAALTASAPEPRLSGSIAGLREALLSPPGESMYTLPRARRALSVVEQQFRNAEYSILVDNLAPVIDAARAVENDPSAAGFASEAYYLAARTLIKVKMLGLAWVAADRAMAAARACGNPLAIGLSTRNLVGLLHREHDYRAAKHMADTGIGRLLDSDEISSDHLAARGILAATGSIAAAHDGDRSTTRDMLDQAREAARLLKLDHTYHASSFGSGHVAVYATSAHLVLGDAGTAITEARGIRPTSIPALERRANYWVNVGSAFSMWEKLDKATEAWLIAEKTAPQEISVARTRTTIIQTSRESGAPRELRALARRLEP